MKIGIVGMGVVGRAIAAFFATKKVDFIWLYDIDKSKWPATLYDIKSCDFIFVCLPTPSNHYGACDTSTIWDFFRLVESTTNHWILKSTVPPGTTDSLASEFKLPNLFHSPEFMSSSSTIADFARPRQILVGGTAMRGDDYFGQCDLFFGKFWPYVPAYNMRAVQSEFIKYLCNCYGAMQVSFFNEMRQIADALECDWQVARNGLLGNETTPATYSSVPGPDGKPGFGGDCFPKDLDALIFKAKELGIKPTMLEATREKNREVRV